MKVVNDVMVAEVMYNVENSLVLSLVVVLVSPTLRFVLKTCYVHFLASFTLV